MATSVETGASSEGMQKELAVAVARAPDPPPPEFDGDPFTAAQPNSGARGSGVMLTPLAAVGAMDLPGTISPSPLRSSSDDVGADNTAASNTPPDATASQAAAVTSGDSSTAITTTTTTTSTTTTVTPTTVTTVPSTATDAAATAAEGTRTVAVVVTPTSDSGDATANALQIAEAATAAKLLQEAQNGGSTQVNDGSDSTTQRLVNGGGGGSHTAASSTQGATQPTLSVDVMAGAGLGAGAGAGTTQQGGVELTKLPEVKRVLVPILVSPANGNMRTNRTNRVRWGDYATGQPLAQVMASCHVSALGRHPRRYNLTPARVCYRLCMRMSWNALVGQSTKTHRGEYTTKKAAASSCETLLA